MFYKTLLVFLVVYCLSYFSDAQAAKKFFREDYTYIEGVESFYKIHSTEKTWDDAKRTCEMEGASLFFPENDDEAHAVISFWNRTQPGLVGWLSVGLSDTMVEGVFETIDGKSISEVYHNWQPDRPDNYGGNENCVHMNRKGYLNDYTCDLKYSFVCKKSLLSIEWKYRCDMLSIDAQKAKKFFRKDYTYIEGVESFYKIHSNPTFWAGAKRTCEMEGASLFFPENDDEAHAVISFWNRTQPKIERMIVGLSDTIVEGVFETTDGKSISEVYNNWSPRQPDNYGGKENCVHMHRKGTLNDYRCDLLQYSFICKKSLLSLEWNYCCDMPNKDYIFNKDFNKCYKLHTTPLNWNEAYAMCRAEQSHLAVISNRLEADYLVNLTKSTPKPRLTGHYQRGLYHLGFHNKDGDWQTVRGTPMNVYADVWWENYQPAGDGGEECGAMFFNGYVIDIDCNMRSSFICEHELDK